MGAVTVGTLDGASAEIRGAIGDDQFSAFGHTAAEINRLRQQGYHRRDYYHGHPELRGTVGSLQRGAFVHDRSDLFEPLYKALPSPQGLCLVLAAFASYATAHGQVSAAYRSPNTWTRRAILAAVRMGRFSSDRTIRECAKDAWDRKINDPQ